MTETTQHENAQQSTPVIESASASTAPQTNDSTFAYWLTASVLGLGATVALAVAMLVYAAFSTLFYSDLTYDDATYYEYEFDNDSEDWDELWFESTSQGPSHLARLG